MGSGTDGPALRRQVNRARGADLLRRLVPLRRIVEVVRHAEDIFDTSRVLFDCGHEGSVSSGAIYRGRCRTLAAQPSVGQPPSAK